MVFYCQKIEEKLRKVKVRTREGSENVMTVEDYFDQVTDIEKKIEYQKDKIATMRSNLISTSMDMSSERVHSSPEQDPLGRQFGTIDEEERKLSHLQEKLSALKERIKVDLSEALHNNIQELILYKRYCEHKKYNAIALELGYSQESIYKKRKEALNKFSLFLKDYSKLQ